MCVGSPQVEQKPKNHENFAIKKSRKNHENVENNQKQPKNSKKFEKFEKYFGDGQKICHYGIIGRESVNLAL